LTYCLGIKIREGLVALADGRVTSGTQVSSARKVAFLGEEGERFFVMTSGLRSLRDKTLSYLGRRLRAAGPGGHPAMIEVVNDYGRSLRQVREEDEEALSKAELGFNLHAILGGQRREDGEPCLYLVYPEGNWIEVDERTPYLSIGANTYGKPILDRALRYDSTMQHALKTAYLSFDSTRFSAADVGYPIDLLTFSLTDRRWRQVQLDYDDCRDQRRWWNEHLKELAGRLPDDPWVGSLVPPGAKRLSVVE